MRARVYLLFFFSVCSLVACESDLFLPSNTFFRLYGGARNQSARDILFNQDDLLLLGATNSFTTDDDSLEAFVVCVDGQGKEKWSLAINGESSETESGDVFTPYVMKSDPAGNTFLIGSINGIGGNSSAVYLVKISPDGLFLWGRQLEKLEDNLSTREVGRDLLVFDERLLLLCSVETQGQTFFYVEQVNPGDGSTLPNTQKGTLGTDIRVNEDNIPVKLFPTSFQDRFIIFANTSEVHTPSNEEEFGGLNVRVTEFTLGELATPPISSVIGGQAGDDNIRGTTALPAGNRFLVYGSQSTSINNQRAFVSMYQRNELSDGIGGIEYRHLWTLGLNDLLPEGEGQGILESEIASAFAFDNGIIRVLLNLTTSTGGNVQVLELNIGGQVLNSNVLTLGGRGDDNGRKIIYQSTSEGYILGELDFQNDNTLISLQKISF